MACIMTGVFLGVIWSELTQLRMCVIRVLARALWTYANPPELVWCQRIESVIWWVHHGWSTASPVAWQWILKKCTAFPQSASRLQWTSPSTTVHTNICTYSTTCLYISGFATLTNSKIEMQKLYWTFFAKYLPKNSFELVYTDTGLRVFICKKPTI